MGLVIGTERFEKELEVTTDYIRLFDEQDCMVDQLVSIAEKYGKEMCGHCVLGYEGVGQFNMILSDISQRKGKSGDIELLLDLCGEMQKHSLCDIGIAAARTIHSAIQNFREEIESHITSKICKAGVCSKFITYHVLADLCKGCGECQNECDNDAIMGKKNFIHVINQDECVQCGDCIKICEYSAIVKAGSVKPRCPKEPIPCKR
jgi:NADH-quinone oxidoreductase subunit F